MPGFLRPAAGHSPQGQVEFGQTHPRSPAHGGGCVKPWKSPRNLSRTHWKIMPQSHSARYSTSQNSTVKSWDAQGKQTNYIGKSLQRALFQSWNDLPRHGGRRGESSPPLCSRDEAGAGGELMAQMGTTVPSAEQPGSERLGMALDPRLQKEAPHPIGGENVKTICRRDMKALGKGFAMSDRHDFKWSRRTTEKLKPLS